MKSQHLHILSINGGGIRGYIPAVILEHLSVKSNKTIPELFDFIIGMSIGGILAATYTAPKKLGSFNHGEVLYNATEVLDMIKDDAEIIFPPNKSSDGVFKST